MPNLPPKNLDPVDRTVEIGTAIDLQPIGLEAGALLGSRYQIEAAIGEGGSGQVFRAWDRVLGEPIALKILRSDRAREKTWIKRLGREVRVARAIRHPNVCRVFDLSTADGHWFVSMELASGGTLRDTLRGARRRPLADRVVDARAICAGLAAIHTVGITHRDVTPQNVLRMADGRLVLSDFGLATDGGDTTIEGGTPRYMAPETAMGQRADHRSDVWQLGSILHELLFDRRPEWDRSDGGLSFRLPVGPAVGDFEQDLAYLCRDCLAQNPADRPATAAEVYARLSGAERGQTERPLRRVLRWRRAIVAAAVLIVVALAGIVLRSSSRALSEPDRRLLRSLAATLNATGRVEDARRLNRLAGPVDQP